MALSEAEARIATCAGTGLRTGSPRATKVATARSFPLEELRLHPTPLLDLLRVLECTATRSFSSSSPTGSLLRLTCRPPTPQLLTGSKYNPSQHPKLRTEQCPADHIAWAFSVSDYVQETGLQLVAASFFLAENEDDEGTSSGDGGGGASSTEATAPIVSQFPQLRYRLSLTLC